MSDQDVDDVIETVIDIATNMMSAPPTTCASGMRIDPPDANFPM